MLVTHRALKAYNVSCYQHRALKPYIVGLAKAVQSQYTLKITRWPVHQLLSSTHTYSHAHTHACIHTHAHTHTLSHTYPACCWLVETRGECARVRRPSVCPSLCLSVCAVPWVGCVHTVQPLALGAVAEGWACATVCTVLI